MKKKKSVQAKVAAPATADSRPLPDWAVILVLLATPLLLFMPYLTGSKMLFGTDWLSSGYGGRLVMTELYHQFKQIPMWNPYVCSGQPTLAGFAADFFYPTAWFRSILPTHVVWTYTFILHLFLAGVGTFYFLKRALKLESYASLIGAVAYMFTGFLVSHVYAGHDGKLITESLFPLMLLCLHLGLERLKHRYFISAGVVMALALHSGHIQSVYYSGLVSLIYLIYFMWQRRKERVWLKQAGGYALMLAVMVGLVAVYYFPIYASLGQGARGTARGYQYAVSWSMPLVELWDFITPNFVGVLDNYWGPNYFKLHLRYLGILPVLLAILAVCLAWRERGTKFWTALFGFSLLMALGGSTPFYRLPYHLLPYINKVRGPDLIFYVAAFAICVLAAIGIQHVSRRLAVGDDRRRRLFTVWLWAAVGAFFLVVVIFALARETISGSMADHYYAAYSAAYGSAAAAEKTAIIAKNYPDLLTGLLRALLLLAVNALLLVLLARRKVTLRTWTLIAGAILLVDLWQADLKFIKPAPVPAQAFPPDAVTTFLQRDQGLYRVFPMYYSKTEEPLISHIQMVSGNLPNPLKRYQDFLGTTGASSQAPNLTNPNFLDVLNVRYIIGLPLPRDTMPYDPQSRAMIRQLRNFFGRYTPVLQDSQYVIYRNDHALPRAWIAPRYQVVARTDQMIAALRLMPDPGQTALLESDPGITVPGIAQGTVEVTLFSPNRITMRATSSAPALLVLSENYHPDWRATVDGRPAAIHPAYHTLRAVFVGAGTHQVVFQYDSAPYRAGRLITLFSIIFVSVVAAWQLAVSQQWLTRSGHDDGTDVANP